MAMVHPSAGLPENARLAGACRSLAHLVGWWIVPLLALFAAVTFRLRMRLRHAHATRQISAVLAEDARDIVVRIDAEGQFVHASPTSLRVLGYRPGTLTGLTLPGICHPDDAPGMRELLNAAPPPRGRIDRVWRVRHADGNFVPMGLFFGISRRGAWVCLLRDVSRWQWAEQKLKESHARYTLLAEYSGDMISVTRADRTRAYVSPAAHSLLGFTPEELLGVDFAMLLHPEDRARVEDTYEAFRHSGGRTTCTYRARRKDGGYVWVESMWTLRPSEELGRGNEVVAVLRDISERKEAELRITFMARHDALTGLANRTLLAERAEDAIHRVARGEMLAVLYLDLDMFKAVNDALGHATGDAVLRAVADRLAACVREIDTVARLGGDEFMVLQVGLERPEDAGLLADRILSVLSAPYDLDGVQVRVDASLGIAIAPVDGAAFETLMQSADMALYRAKNEGRNTWRFFEPGMDARRIARQQLELDLRKALEQQEFELFYMPLVSVRDDRITGFEALLRWRHPARGMVQPGEFIPIAEETGLIVPIGAWVLRRACAEAADWPKAVTVAVNLSPVQLRLAALVNTVREALAESGLAPQRLELEITESVLLEDNETTLASLNALRELGVRISLDDFGTGYSSLRYLRSFPFDKIKLDKSFVGDLSNTAGGLAIVRAVAGLGRSLGIATVAEGVETAAQLKRLRAEGYTEVQGFYFGRPGPYSTVATSLAREGKVVDGRGKVETASVGK